ncbi:MAG TPA: apolipoprotein N-acyltransferase [Vicinamibacterales bacterium]|nr:apolipoprotein N-acyltransferase [Vicinamibacterales bacterium]
MFSGLLLALSFPRFGNPGVAWIALAPLIVAVTGQARAGASLPRLFRLGAAAGVFYFCGTLYWLANVMAIHGHLHIAVAGLLAFGLALYLSVFVGLFAVVLGVATRRRGAAAVWLAPLFWVATEWLRAWLGADFPWVLLGSSQTGVLPIVQFASLTGVYGISALVVLVSSAAAALALGTDRRTVIRAAVTAITLVTIATWGAWRLGRSPLTSSGTPVRVGLLQGNVPQEAKSDPAYRDAITDRYVSLSRDAIGAGAELVIWPEASTPFYFDIESNLAAPVRRLAAESRVPFVIGTDEFERGRNGSPDRYYNTAVLVGATGQTMANYRKIRLVPFGEYVPFKKLLFFVGPLIEAVSDFSAGTTPTIFDAGGRKFSVAICYEAVYAGMARAFVESGSQLLTTITNDAWFGRSSAAFQHFDQAALRAVEQGRYLVRAANTGFSGAVDPYGRVLAKSALFETTSLTVDVRLLTDRTLYSRIGDAVAYAGLIVSALVLIRRRRG